MILHRCVRSLDSGPYLPTTHASPVAMKLSSTTNLYLFCRPPAQVDQVDHFMWLRAVLWLACFRVGTCAVPRVLEYLTLFPRTTAAPFVVCIKGAVYMRVESVEEGGQIMLDAIDHETIQYLS